MCLPGHLPLGLSALSLAAPDGVDERRMDAGIKPPLRWDCDGSTLPVCAASYHAAQLAVPAHPLSDNKCSYKIE